MCNIKFILNFYKYYFTLYSSFNRLYVFYQHLLMFNVYVPSFVNKMKCYNMFKYRIIFIYINFYKYKMVCKTVIKIVISLLINF